jgi:hypothetical protein
MQRTAFLSVVALVLPMSGCDLLEDAKDGVKPPQASFMGMEVVKAPTANNAAAWACYEWLDSFTCQAAGWDSRPGDQKMKISLDFGFELSNRNTDLPIPLVELLLGMTVIENTNLGSVCISFCDPDEEECIVERNAEGACSMDDVTDIKEPSDLIPTVDDLLDLTEDIAAGEMDEENNTWRYIPPQDSVESHVRFNLSTATVYRLAEELVMTALEDYLAGDDISLAVPYTVDGSLFFNVPQMGRYALGFGPTEERSFQLIR